MNIIYIISRLIIIIRLLLFIVIQIFFLHLVEFFLHFCNFQANSLLLFKFLNTNSILELLFNGISCEIFGVLVLLNRISW